VATQPRAPTQNREERGSLQADKTVEREGGTTEGEQPLRGVPMLKKMLTLKETLTKRKTATTPFGPRTHGVLACAYTSKHH